MRLTQKQEEEILAIYEKWLDSYLSGDIDTYDSYFDDDYHFIGSTGNEEFLNRKNTTEFFRKTSDQFAGKTDLRNNIKTVEKFGNIVFVTHLFDAWFLDEGDWTYYGRFRFSNALHETKDGWRFIYQHFSMPDAKADEGETIGFDQISAENLQLKEAIQRRTKELEEKSRELQIEAAIEKVRARSLEMQHTSELQDVINTVHYELIKLKLPISGGAFIVINSDIQDELLCWGAGGTTDYVEKVHAPFLNKPIYKGLVNSIKKGPGFFTEEFNYNEKIELFEHLFKHPPYLDSDELHKKEVLSREGGYTRSCAVFKNTSIFIINHHGRVFTEFENNVLKRFGSVFEQAYTRFLDLEKAEAQTREAQVETALERVRSRTMAMQKSAELPEAANVLFNEIRKLGIPAWSAGYNILSEDRKSSTCIMSSEGELQEPFILPLTEHESLLPWYQAILNEDEFFVYGQEGEDLVRHYEYMKSLPELQTTFEQFEKAGLDLPTRQFNHLVRFNKGFLLFITYEQVPDAHKIFQRFGKVFEQTYTRFLDLQKAEAQAREAQIEAALERIRSKALAMNQSVDLLDIVVKMRKEFIDLGHESHYFWHMMWSPEVYQKAMTSGDGSRIGFVMELPRHIHGEIPLLAKWEKGKEPTVVYAMNTTEAIDYIDKMVELGDFQQIDPQAPSHEDIRHIGGLTFIMTRTTHGEIGYSLPGKIENPPEESIKLLERFAEAFDLVHRRFLDLKKAEAQAREAQIEIALERVRSRTMGMQHSSELQETAALLFDQIKDLDINVLGCGFNIWNQDRSEATAWMSGIDRFQSPFQTSSSKDIFLRIYESMKRGDKLFVEEQEGEELKAHYDYMASIPVFKKILKQLEEKGQSPPSFQIMHCAFFSHGYLMFITLNPATEEHEIFTRFAKVFEQTYTRFLDLQKAEKQAREAEINLALERIRASTMAMHSTEEIGQTVITFFEELRGLGLQKSTRCGIGILSQSEHMQLYTASTKKGYKTKLTTGILDMSIHPLLKGVENAWKNGEPAFSYELKGKDKYEYFNELNRVRNYPVNIDIKNLPEIVYHFSFPFKDGVLFVFLDDLLTSEYAEIFKRFANSFSATYTRFLDLKKAEAQAREADIQLALERVRARTMAMQKSEELSEAASDMFKQIEHLGLQTWSCGFNIFDHQKKTIMQWVSSGDGRILPPFETPATEDVFIRIYNASKRGESLYVEEMGGQQLVNTYKYLTSLPTVGTIINELNEAGIQLPKFQVDHAAFYKQGYLMFITYEQVPEFHEIFKRFAKVFEQTYTRFLDLQRAEAQAREARIEAALEKVRSRSLAMQKSKELEEVIKVVFDQFVQLEFNIEHAGFIMDYRQSENMHIWLTDRNAVPAEVSIPYFDTPHWNSFLKAKKDGENFFTNQYTFEEKNKFYQELFELIPGIAEETKDHYQKCKGLAISTVLMNNVGLYIENFEGEAFSEEENETLMRFGKVFQQTYTRFCDLEKAEAQARQAQIETALEKVRSHSMGMQNSNDFSSVTTEMFNQLRNFGGDLYATGIVFCDKHKDHVEQWHSIPGAGMMSPLIVPKDLDYIHEYRYNQWKKGEKLFSIEIPGDFIEQHFQDIFNLPSAQKVLEDMEENNTPMPGAPPWEIDYGASFKNGYILVSALQPFEEVHILPRFASAFEQAYTRYLDLKKAEAQARQAQIETALERVRSRSMGMQKSEELADLSLELVKQVQELGVTTWFCAFNIYDEDDKGSMEWGSNGEGVFPRYRTPREGVFLKYYKAGQEGQTLYVNEIGENECPAHYEYLCTLPGVGDQLLKMKEQGIPFPTSQIDHVAFFKYGYVIFITYEPVPESHEIFKRFARVFEQTYTRFLDLQKAEERAMEAKIETALEKVRSRTLAMQNSQEFEETSVVVFKQLLELGISPNRLFIGIIDPDAGIMDAWATNEDGTKLVSKFQLKASENKSIARMLEGWKQGETSQVIDMKGKELKDYFQYLGKELNIPFEHGLEQKRRIQYLAYFSGGVIGMASGEEQNEETLELLERFAAVFNLTYIRFKDLKVAEANALKAEQDLIEIKAARKNAEKALTELQQTQKQLIQSEKMASLGELTAGIAHEIQNPLNFVNNFSEVSNELMDEIFEEFENGNLEEVREILNDITHNLNKINHHGKRADAIVKGMLQHSKGSSGHKEPTDINALCDEYLRLSYHGLRAKDKSFNATFETHFDTSLPKIKVVPQDIGRAILNLINNAFYATQEQPTTNNQQFEPLVTVSTKNLGDKIEISVQDNGPGIPEQIKEKIFQPFFSTKPTGQGTGLGLSLSYDIVKAHGGAIEVATQKGKGTTFTIIIKTNQ